MNKKKKKTYYGNEPKDEDEEKLSSNLLLKWSHSWIHMFKLGPHNWQTEYKQPIKPRVRSSLPEVQLLK